MSRRRMVSFRDRSVDRMVVYIRMLESDRMLACLLVEHNLGRVVDNILGRGKDVDNRVEVET